MRRKENERKVFRRVRKRRERHTNCLSRRKEKCAFVEPAQEE